MATFRFRVEGRSGHDPMFDPFDLPDIVSARRAALHLVGALLQEPGNDQIFDDKLTVDILDDQGERLLTIGLFVMEPQQRT